MKMNDLAAGVLVAALLMCSVAVIADLGTDADGAASITSIDYSGDKGALAFRFTDGVYDGDIDEAGGRAVCTFETVLVKDGASRSVPLSESLFTSGTTYVIHLYSIRDGTEVGSGSFTVYTVSFAAGTGSGSMDSVKASGSYVLPECGFTAPAGSSFKAWSVDGTEYQPGKTITVSGDTAVTALWTTEKQTYSIGTSFDSEKGSIAAGSSAVEGSTVKFTVSANSGYRIESATVSYAGGTIDPVEGTDGTYTFEMPAGDVTITATFTEASYKVTGTFVNGSVEGLSDSVKYKAQVTLEPKPVTGFNLASISAECNGAPVGLTESDGKYTFEMPAGDVTITATFTEASYKVTVNGSDNGFVTASPESANAGDQVKLTPAPATGYRLESISVSYAGGTIVPVEGTDGTYTFTMPAADVTITAAFGKAEYTITYANCQNGSVTGVQKASYGDSVELTVSPDEGYALKSLKYGSTDIELKDGKYAFTMPAEDVTITAQFAKVSFKVSGEFQHGSVTGVPNSVEFGAQVTLKPVSDVGYELKEISAMCGSVVVTLTEGADGTYTFEMPAGDVTVSATFEKIMLDVTVVIDPSAGGIATLTGEGIVSAGDGTYSVPYGTDVVLNIVQGSGYKIDYLTDNLDSKDPALEYKLNVTEDHDIVVGFIKTSEIQYTVTLDIGQGGSIDPAGTDGKYVMYNGQSKTFVITADSTHKIKSVTLGAEMLDVTDKVTMPVTVSRISEDLTIKVEFEEAQTYAVDVPEDTADGKVSVSGLVDGKAVEGRTITITVTPAAGYVVDHVKVNGLDARTTLGAVSYDYTILVDSFLAGQDKLVIDVGFAPFSDDDDDDPVPTPVPVPSDGSDDDSAVKIMAVAVACVAAAIIALYALFLRKE